MNEMTISVNGPDAPSEVDFLIQLFRAQGDFVPRREWLQWHVDHQTSLKGIFNASGVKLPETLPKDGAAA